jgi:predicted porin
MNKKVIALAVAGTLALPLAAKAQTANVTMYGSFRMTVESTDLQGVGRNTHVDSWSSRWGVRGIESLGGGLNGMFLLELQPNIDNPGGAVVESTAAGTNASVRYQPLQIRESWVGLTGGFGTFKMGSGLTPYDDVLGMDHLLLANGFENQTTLGGGAGPINRSGGFTAYGAFGPAAVSQGSGTACNSGVNYDARYGESLRYESPSFSGLTFTTQFAFLGENSSGFKCKGWDSSVIYSNGPIEAAFAYSRHIDFQLYDGNAWRGHAGYNFGFLKLQGAYERFTYDGNNGTSGSAQARYYNFGVVVPIGPGVLTAQYGTRDKSVLLPAVGSNGPITVNEAGGGKQYTMSYKYGFSKRTYVYGFAARVNAESGIGIEGGPVGGRATAVGFGVQHNF